MGGELLRLQKKQRTRTELLGDLMCKCFIIKPVSYYMSAMWQVLG